MSKFKFILNDETKVNQFGFRVKNSGLRLGRFRANPVILDNHKEAYNAFFSSQILYDDRVAPTLTSSGESVYWEEKRNINDTEYSRMSTFPSDFDFCGQKVRYVCGMSVPPLMTAKIAQQIKEQWFNS